MNAAEEAQHENEHVAAANITAFSSLNTLSSQADTKPLTGGPAVSQRQEQPNDTSALVQVFTDLLIGLVKTALNMDSIQMRKIISLQLSCNQLLVNTLYTTVQYSTALLSGV